GARGGGGPADLRRAAAGRALRTRRDTMTSTDHVRSPDRDSLPLRIRSRWQELRLARERGGLMFRLNGSPQVFGPEEPLYHEACATLPMMLARRARRVLVLGGGDG